MTNLRYLCHTMIILMQCVSGTCTVKIMYVKFGHFFCLIISRGSSGANEIHFDHANDLLSCTKINTNVDAQLFVDYVNNGLSEYHMFSSILIILV